MDYIEIIDSLIDNFLLGYLVQLYTLNAYAGNDNKKPYYCTAMVIERNWKSKILGKCSSNDHLKSLANGWQYSKM